MSVLAFWHAHTSVGGSPSLQHCVCWSSSLIWKIDTNFIKINNTNKWHDMGALERRYDIDCVTTFDGKKQMFCLASAFCFSLFFFFPCDQLGWPNPRGARGCPCDQPITAQLTLWPTNQSRPVVLLIASAITTDQVPGIGWATACRWPWCSWWGWRRHRPRRPWAGAVGGVTWRVTPSNWGRGGLRWDTWQVLKTCKTWSSKWTHGRKQSCVVLYIFCKTMNNIWKCT